MKFIYTVLLVFLISSISFSQKKNADSLIVVAIQKKEPSYFKLQKHFRRIRFTNEQILKLLNESINSKYLIGEIFAKNIQGRAHRNVTEYNKAIEKHNEALNLSKKIKSIEAEIVTLNQLGVIYRRQDKIRRALNYHQSALDIILKVDKPSSDIKISNSITVNSIGNIYLTLKQYEKALEKFSESITLQKELNDYRGLAINHQNIGYALKNIGDLELALENFQKSLKYNILNKSKIGKVICHNSISDILIKQRKYNEAHKYIIEVVKLAERLNNRYYLSEVYNTLGLALLRLGRLKESRNYLNKAHKIAVDNNIPSSLVLSYSHLSELNEKEKNYKESLAFFKKSNELEKKTFNAKNIRYVNSLINKYDSEVSSNKLKSLARENEIAKLRLLRNRNILIISLVSIALFGVLLYSIYRQRLLKNDKQILVLEQEALRIQMNPHFVFNALNSIKLYVINNEQKNAVHYLNKFSKLIRSILESSSVKEVTLSEELKTMNLYMSIENIRFSNEITYIENIDEDLNLERIKIPPLVLQPFLENSIWHGLSSKKGEKKVTLSVNKFSEEFIEICVTDNGIGRDAAFKIKSNKSLNRKSIGIHLTKERLNNFSNEFMNPYSITYIDLFDEKGKPNGTKVSLKLPII